MRKFVQSLLVVMTATVVLVALAAEIPETVTIDECAAKKEAVEFPHKVHVELAACTDCHHTSEGLTAETAADMEVATCASCHAEPADENVPDCAQMSLKKNPFHITCVGCHKEHAKENADTKAPTKCNECHVKAES